jgi:carbon-monoxide dehydrogenase medium subunit
VIYSRPKDLESVLAALGSDPQAMALAGGQSLLAAMRLGLTAPSHLIDLQSLACLRGIELKDGGLSIGAMTSHADIASHPTVRSEWPFLSSVAAGIADPQVRAVGTIGGSLANNDPAACWPAAVLAARGLVMTSKRRIAADDFFKGLFATALEPGELITQVWIPPIRRGVYLKFEQAASRFALVGVALVEIEDGTLRVAVTGLGGGVYRWHEAEARLASGLDLNAMSDLSLNSALASDDIHADAQYRAHLAAVLLRRAAHRFRDA